MSGAVQIPSLQWMTPVFMHINHTSNSSSVLSNSYSSLLSDLCACVQVKKMVLQMKP